MTCLRAIILAISLTPFLAACVAQHKPLDQLRSGPEVMDVSSYASLPMKPARNAVDGLVS